MTNRQTESTARAASLVPALALLALTLLLLSGFLVVQAIAERNSLLAAKAAQDQPLQQTQQVEAQLEMLVSGTAKLAEQGHVGAKDIIAAMKRAGITVKP